MLQGLKNNTTLKVLNLSKNYLTEDIAKSLTHVLERSVVTELYLHWNLLKAPFGKLIFANLLENERLAVLDLSNNSLGIGPGDEECEDCIKEMNNFFETNRYLVHLDLSSNHFNYE